VDQASLLLLYAAIDISFSSFQNGPTHEGQYFCSDRVLRGP
jgi:hypothetical protein